MQVSEPIGRLLTRSQACPCAKEKVAGASYSISNALNHKLFCQRGELKAKTEAFFEIKPESQTFEVQKQVKIQNSES